MADPLIDSADLARYLNDPSLDEDRAMDAINDAQTLCESILSPLPAAAAVIVKRVAGRAYITAPSPRAAQLAAANGQPIGAAGMGGAYLTRSDKADLRRIARGSTAFSINMLPATYAAIVPPWDVSIIGPTVQ